MRVKRRASRVTTNQVDWRCMPRRTFSLKVNHRNPFGKPKPKKRDDKPLKGDPDRVRKKPTNHKRERP